MSANNMPDGRAAQREYMREWRRKNREKVAESQRRYWAKKAAETRSLEQMETRSTEPANQAAAAE